MTKFVNIAGAARVLAVASLVCSVAQAQTPQPPSFAKATDDRQWTMPANDAASTRYSSLDEINAQNVKNLKVAFALSQQVWTEARKQRLWLSAIRCIL